MSDELIDTATPGTLLACYNKALRLLSYREHSGRELADKLLQASFTRAVIEATLTELTNKNFLNDERFAGQYILSRAGRGFGPVRITLELQERGVAESAIAHGFAEVNCDWAELAEQARRKKFGAAVPTEFVEQVKQQRFLAYRGFNHE